MTLSARYILDSPEHHEAANIFPMDDEHLRELAEDIKANGLRMPIELLDGRVIDGRRRLKACEIANVQPAYRNVVVSDPVAYVMSLNLHRRHLTPSQLSMVAARVRSIYEEQAKARMVQGGARGGQSKGMENLPSPSTARDAAGKAVGVSGKSVDFATRVLSNGTPELVQAVDDGRIAVSTAAVIATDPPEEQRRYVESKATRKYRSTKGGGEFGGITQKEEKNAQPEPTRQLIPLKINAIQAIRERSPLRRKAKAA